MTSFRRATKALSFILLLFMCLTLGAINAPAKSLNDSERWKYINNILRENATFFNDNEIESAKSKTGNSRYYLQMFLNNVTIEAIRTSRTDTRDKLLMRFERELQYLHTVTSYVYYEAAGYKTRPLEQPHRIWVEHNGRESALNSSQFVFLLASTIRALVERKEDYDARAAAFVRSAAPVVADHLTRWIFGPSRRWQVRGWGCEFGLYSHLEFMKEKLAKAFGRKMGPPYCNSITDIDTWIIASAAEWLNASLTAPKVILLSTQQQQAYKEYLRIATKAMMNRTETRIFANALNEPVQGLVFDPGAWDRHPEYRYSGYSGTQCPSSDHSRISRAGWDFSHGTRLVEVTMSLYAVRDKAQLSWPTRSTMTGFAAALVHGVWNGDIEKPRFRNFLDGSNGWYRVEQPPCQGFHPWGLSIAILYGSWGRWAEFYPPLTRMLDAVWTMLSSTKPDVVTFRKTVFESNFTRNKKVTFRPDVTNVLKSRQLLPFLSSYPMQ